MSSPLPPEVLDLILDFLHDDRDALKACCLASRSWVHRTRQYLFVRVEFSLESHVKLWEETFPDPSNSPARYTRSLTIHRFQEITSVANGVGCWIRAFSGIVRLHVNIYVYSARAVSSVPLRGLSPALKSLRLTYGCSVPPSEIFGLVCSFPLLEDLALYTLCDNSEVDGWNIPSTSPKFTGYLDLAIPGGIRPTVDRLLELPSGLHFSKISVVCLVEDVKPMIDLVSECSDTLESLSIYYYLEAKHSAPVLDLSKLTKLKDVVFGCTEPSVRRITMTLQTAQSINLQQITVQSSTTVGKPIVESAYQGWQDLDRLLLQFWTSHSIRPKIVFKDEEEGCILGHLVQKLFPELTRRGIVDLVE